jgi:pimeloyl-ACP methyl ester carboxylesterase
MPQKGALVIYGRGADLGNFKFFADDLVTTELASYGKSNISINNVERRDAFFQLLLKPPLIIRELHIYSHSIGGGLYLGYKDHDLDRDRGIAAANGKLGSYLTVLNTEKGAVLTDDLIRPPYIGYRDRIRANFDSNAKIKIWGCNSGVTNWV